jgi:hypothetical protein
MDASQLTDGVILLDVPAGGGAFEHTVLERLGHPVTVCNGPVTATLCPLLGGAGCEWFEHARGIVFELDLDRPQHRAIITRYQELADPDTPIRVVVGPGQRERYEGTLAGVQLWDHQPTVADLDGFAAQVEAVDRFG